MASGRTLLTCPSFFIDVVVFLYVQAQWSQCIFVQFEFSLGWIQVSLHWDLAGDHIHKVDNAVDSSTVMKQIKGGQSTVLIPCGFSWTSSWLCFSRIVPVATAATQLLDSPGCLVACRSQRCSISECLSCKIAGKVKRLVSRIVRKVLF